MSPIIKQSLPTPGSITTEMVAPPRKLAAESQQTDLLSMGWRIQSLNTAADSLLDSAARLEKEIAKETSYWEQVLHVKEDGWSLSRMPREQHTLGVHFGYAEANRKFRDQGQAALRLSAEGKLFLDRNADSSKRLAVRLLQGGKEVSSYANFEGTSDEESINQQIKSARDAIFDAELFYELDREARFLVNQGVTSRTDSITLPYKAGGQIEICLLPQGKLPTASPFEAPDSFLKGLLLALHILLTQAHGRAHEARIAKPKPFSHDTRPTAPLPILKTVVEVFSHQAAEKELRARLDKLGSVLRSAGLTVEIEQSPLPLPTSSGERTDALSALLQTLTSTKTHFVLENCCIAIDCTTSLLPPVFGTVFRVASPMVRPPDHTNEEAGVLGDEVQTSEPPGVTEDTSLRESASLHSLPEAFSEISHRVQERLKDFVVDQSGGSTKVERGIQWLVRSGKDALQVDLSDKLDSLTLSWRGLPAHKGQQAWVWTGPDGDETRTLKEVLENI